MSALELVTCEGCHNEGDPADLTCWCCGHVYGQPVYFGVYCPTCEQDCLPLTRRSPDKKSVIEFCGWCETVLPRTSRGIGRDRALEVAPACPRCDSITETVDALFCADCGASMNLTGQRKRAVATKARSRHKPRYCPHCGVRCYGARCAKCRRQMEQAA